MPRHSWEARKEGREGGNTVWETDRGPYFLGLPGQTRMSPANAIYGALNRRLKRLNGNRLHHRGLDALLVQPALFCEAQGIFCRALWNVAVALQGGDKPFLGRAFQV